MVSFHICIISVALNSWQDWQLQLLLMKQILVMPQSLMRTCSQTLKMFKLFNSVLVGCEQLRWIHILLCFLLLWFTAVVVGFERHTYTVREREEQVELCAKIRMPGQQDIGTVTFNLTVETQDASAGTSNSKS